MFLVPLLVAAAAAAECAAQHSSPPVGAAGGIAMKFTSASSDEANVVPKKALSGVPFRRGNRADPNDLRRIEYLTVTVDDMQLVARFYLEVLGAHELDLCGRSDTEHCTDDGAVRFSGSQHQDAIFGRNTHDKLPNIADGGTEEVRARFFVLGNTVVQLLSFVTKSSGQAFALREPMTSPVFVGQAHIDFLMEEGLDMNAYIADMETKSHARSMPQVKFNRPLPQESRADRDKVPESKYANKVVGSPFDGLAWAYFKGPIGEQYEMYQFERTIRRAVGKAYCERGAVSGAFIDDGKAPTAKSTKKSLSQRVYGAFQYGYRTANLHRAVGFYGEVLGGDLIPYPTHGSEIMKDDTAHWMILANETVEAYEYATAHGVTRDAALRHFGVPNISSGGFNRLDHRFVLFDNFVVEPLQYTDGLSFGGDGFDPRLGHGSSLAYIGTVTAAFGLSEGMDRTTYLHALRARLEHQGFRDVVLPLGFGSFAAGHPFEGLEYGYAKGPDGEAIALAQIGGAFRAKLHEALLASGGVSTMFADTNPFAKGDMQAFCAYAEFDGHYDAFLV